MKIKGYSFKCEKPFFVYCKKHYCPSCGDLLAREKVSEIIHSDSEEAKNYDFEVADITVKGNMKFTHIEFHCPNCQKNYSIQAIQREESTMAYKDMLDSAFTKYYDRFRERNALSKETAVTRDELFPEGETMVDVNRMHKMLSMNIVKRVGLDRYWLDEKRAADGNSVLKQRIILIAIAVVVGVIVGILARMGILNI